MPSDEAQMLRTPSELDEQLGSISEVLPDVLELFRRLDHDSRKRLFKTLSALLFNTDHLNEQANGPITTVPAQPTERFSREVTLTPKEFLLKKQPRTESERVACLGYYLSHYRDQPHFKTFDISSLNTEAAQIKLSNPRRAVENATRSGYLTTSTKGSKQLSAGGEMWVEAMPDREAASAAMAHAKPRRVSAKRKKAA